MEPYKFTDYLQKILSDAVALNERMEASGLLLLFEAPIDWKRLKKFLGETYFIAAATNAEALVGDDALGDLLRRAYRLTRT